MSVQDSIHDSVDLEERSPQSTRLFTKVAILISTVALLLLFGCIILFQVDEILGINVFSSIFIPEVILFLIAFYLAITERLRAKYMGARLAILITILVFIGIMGFIAFELIKYHEIFIAPFNPPPQYKANKY